MASFRITITPSQRAAGRFVSRVRRAIQKALAEETQKNGITQSDLARSIGVNRSVVCREIRGHKDMTLGRVAELAWALGRKPVFELPEQIVPHGNNQAITTPSGTSPIIVGTTTSAAATGGSDKSGWAIAFTAGP